MVLSSAIVCDHDRRIADDRRSMFPYDRRRSQTLLRSAICDPRSYGDQPLCSIFCDRLRSSAIMIAGSQTIAEVCFHMIADDRRRSQTLLRSAICDPRSYGNQPLDRTWFYLLRLSAITIAGSQAIAEAFPYDRRRSQTLLRSAIRDHMETSLNWKTAKQTNN